MTNTKTTKRAFLASMLSVLLCFAMLIGSTFAWFTDTAKTNVNTIKSGNLDVVLEVSYDNGANWEDANGKTIDFIAKDGNKNILWEPGCTYELPLLRVRNEGNLWLKYQLAITGIKGDAKLNEAIEWKNGTEVLDVASLNSWTELAPKGTDGNTSADIKIAGHMKEEAGNEYQGLSIDGVAITVFATQLNKESDSFGPDYDKNAPTLITVDGEYYATIGEAFEATGKTTFNVSGPIDMTKLGNLFKTANQNVTFNQMEGYPAAYYDFSNTAVNANNANITVNGGYIQGKSSNTGNGFGFQHTNGTIIYKNVTINDSWTNENTATITYDSCIFTGTYYVWTYSVPQITFTNCEFNKEDSRAILVYSHGNNPITANITNCTFKADEKGYAYGPKWTAAVEVDASIISDGATVNITGCTADSNYNGIVRDKGGKNANITVDGAAIVSNPTALAQAIFEKKANIVLSAGNYTMADTDYDVTISGTKDAVLNIPDGVKGGNNTITFKNITIVGADDVASASNLGTFHTTQLNGAKKANYKNCTIKGMISTYCNSDFTDCVFENDFEDEYSAWCYGAAECNFTNCTFNTPCSKAIKLFNEGQGGATLNVKGCTFNTTTVDKAAVEIDSTHTTAGYTVNISNSTINGAYTKLWNDKADNSTVTVDGVA